MAATMDQPGHILDAQVAAFRKAVPLYREMSRVLERELGQLARQVCPGAMVSARAKTVASFAEKILRKNKYRDPLQEITDLCGARVIVDLLAQVAEVGALIRQNFTVDEDNTVDASARLSASEFGYRSVHYIVSFRRDRHPGLPAKFYGAKVEVQVRTSAQHAWSAVGHDRIYKSPYPVPEALLRDAARIAAQLESADDEFARMVKELEEYHHNVEVYLPGGKLDAEVKLQDTIARHDPGNAAVALRRAQLALAADRWMVAIGVVRNFPGSGTPALRAILGHALCRLHSGDPRSPAYRRGQKCLLQAAEAMPADAGTWVRLADTYEHGEPARALRYYRAAYAADAADPAALIGCIRLQMAVTGEKEFVTLLRPAIEAAIRRCEAQAALQIELPAALYHAAVLHLLLEPDDRYEALRSLARAIWRTQTPSPIRVALGTVQVMARLHPDRADIEYARRLLQLAWHARSPDAKSRKTVKRLATPNATPIAGPVVIVVGFCDPKLRKNVPAARKILRAALRGFRGTIISGGTRQGVAGLAGELGADSGGAIRTIGYLPKTLPGNRSATRDERYTEIRLSQGKAGFSPVEPLQNWADLLVSGIAPETVTVLGIGGGQIAAVEYRLALALGARVGLILDSGRQADALANDPEWAENHRLLRLRREILEPATLTALMHQPSGRVMFEPRKLDELGERVHVNYLKSDLYSEIDPSRRKWRNLPPDLKQSNQAQIAYAAEILATEGYAIVPHAGNPDDIILPKFNRRQIERMAKLEHGRWNIERLSAGWSYGKPKDVQRRITPWLVSYRKLPDGPDGMKKYDREAIGNYAEVLRKSGFAIVRATA